MTSAQDYQLLLDNIWKAYDAGQSRLDIHDSAHELAEAQYWPALEFFLKLIEDQDWDWRLEGVQLAGFHYDLSENSSAMDVLRFHLTADQSSQVRGACAHVLGAQSGWPEQVLMTALAGEADSSVKEDIFYALLTLAGLSFPLIRQELQYMRESDSGPNIEELERVLDKNNISL